MCCKFHSKYLFVLIYCRPTCIPVLFATRSCVYICQQYIYIYMWKIIFRLWNMYTKEGLNQKLYYYCKTPIEAQVRMNFLKKKLTSMSLGTMIIILFSNCVVSICQSTRMYWTAIQKNSFFLELAVFFFPMAFETNKKKKKTE